jgi:hypothetical protein
VRPAGLRHDIAPLTASAVTNPSEAMIDDMAKLAGAVAVFGDPILFVAAPERATAISLRLRPAPPFDVLASPALAAGDLIAVAGYGVASAVDAVPQIESSRVATVHMDDVPLPIGQAGPILATPTRSLWQAGTVGIKIRFNVDWALRDPRALAWTTTTAW